MVIVSGRLDLPWDAPLFTEGVGRCLIATSSEVDPPETATAVEVLRQPGGVDLRRAARRTCARELGVRALLCEGGPRLHGQLIDAGLVDELFVTHAPKLAGGAGPGLVAGLRGARAPARARLAAGRGARPASSSAATACRAADRAGFGRP